MCSLYNLPLTDPRANSLDIRKVRPGPVMSRFLYNAISNYEEQCSFTAYGGQGIEIVKIYYDNIHISSFTLGNFKTRETG